MSADVLELAAAPPPVRGRRISGNTTWLLKRLALGLLVLFAVSVIVFAATTALPSDPARAILGRDASPQQLDALRHQLGLDQPLISQYLSWLGHVATGDLGTSLASGQSVWSMVGPRLTNSLTLVAIVMALALPLALLLGTVTALRRDGLFDRGVFIASLCVTALPEFVVGLGLVFLFATGVFSILPAVTLLDSGDSVLSSPKELVLPVVTLVLAILPYLYRLTRASAIEALESEYVTMARLKGVRSRRLLLLHVLPNAAIPVIQGVALMLTWLLGGIVVVEFVFRFPGLGTLLTDAVSNRDVPLIQGIVLVFAAGVVVFNVAADVLTLFLSPRLRTAGRARRRSTP